MATKCAEIKDVESTSAAATAALASKSTHSSSQVAKRVVTAVFLKKVLAQIVLALRHANDVVKSVRFPVSGRRAHDRVENRLLTVFPNHPNLVALVEDWHGQFLSPPSSKYGQLWTDVHVLFNFSYTSSKKLLVKYTRKPLIAVAARKAYQRAILCVADPYPFFLSRYLTHAKDVT